MMGVIGRVATSRGGGVMEGTRFASFQSGLDGLKSES